MNFSLVILCISLSIFSCEGATLDYSNITPWSVTYAVYPSVQDPDLLVEVWKNERKLDVSDNTVELRSNDDQETDSNVNRKISGNNYSQKDSHSSNQNNQHLNFNQEIQTQIWPQNYRNWPKN